MAKRILIIEDDADMIMAATDLLKDEGYLVTPARSAEEGLESLRNQPPDLILLDVRLPGKDGYETCKTIKSDPKTANIPVLMISVKTQGADVAIGLGMGADDYIRKPFDPRELMARVKTALLRNAESASTKISIGALTVDYDRYEATLNGAPIKLTPKEFELLGYFMKNEGRVLTRPKLSENIWGVEYNPTSKTIEFHVDSLRKKLGTVGGWVKVLKGVGYRFESDGD